ncbi:hypothetical protein BJV77DRAFT_1034860 [Russula vinacea]|nr:hypothetical protein BJV77DRAFT_1034860 [Russula vinacea]
MDALSDLSILSSSSESYSHSDPSSQSPLHASSRPPNLRQAPRPSKKALEMTRSPQGSTSATSISTIRVRIPTKRGHGVTNSRAKKGRENLRSPAPSDVALATKMAFWKFESETSGVMLEAAKKMLEVARARNKTAKKTTLRLSRRRSWAGPTSALITSRRHLQRRFWRRWRAL